MPIVALLALGLPALIVLSILAIIGLIGWLVYALFSGDFFGDTDRSYEAFKRANQHKSDSQDYNSGIEPSKISESSHQSCWREYRDGFYPWPGTREYARAPYDRTYHAFVRVLFHQEVQKLGYFYRGVIKLDSNAIDREWHRYLSSEAPWPGTQEYRGKDRLGSQRPSFASR